MANARNTTSTTGWHRTWAHVPASSISIEMPASNIIGHAPLVIANQISCCGSLNTVPSAPSAIRPTDIASTTRMDTTPWFHLVAKYTSMTMTAEANNIAITEYSLCAGGKPLLTKASVMHMARSRVLTTHVLATLQRRRQKSSRTARSISANVCPSSTISPRMRWASSSQLQRACSELPRPAEARVLATFTCTPSRSAVNTSYTHHNRA
mmetsp:Transcript_32404/g.97919  ORF Transcript_32404/g.97919 Transcript_32404/m.97919 type:complete len:209 (-) Transcript_32404:444-1070(-)